MDFYKIVNRYTKIDRDIWIPEKLEFDYQYLFDIVKSILIHPLEAKAMKVKYDHERKGIFHCENSTVEKILNYPRLEKYLDEHQLPLKTAPNDRAVLSCDHHSLLFVSLVRYLGIPARARTGYCKYIIDGLLVPHWVAEIYDENLKKWHIVDPERQLTEIDDDGFLFAAEVWKNHMETGKVYSSYSGFSGRHGLKLALLCDLNCIFKNELLSYEWRLKAHNRKKPSVASTSYDRFTESDKRMFDTIAIMMRQPDEHMNELWAFYEKIVEEQDLEVSGYAEFKNK